MDKHAVLAPFIVWLVEQRNLPEAERSQCRHHAETFLTWLDAHPDLRSNAAAANAYTASLLDAGTTPQEVADAHRAVALLQRYLKSSPLRSTPQGGREIVSRANP